ncbi:FAD:protein FMN transferase [bacterium]|nr:FAD:protein FMN transferase [bacterium]
MNRLESWLLHLSTIVLTVTGLGYAWMHYLMKPDDPFSVVNHPWEPHFLSTHILVAPLLMLGFGMVLHSHILFKISAGARSARKTGLVLIPLFAAMVISGYLLQVVVSDFRKILLWVHLGTGSLWSLFYLVHQIASYAQRRAKQNGSPRYRIPVQVLLIVALAGIVFESQAETFEREVYSMGTSLRIVLMEEDPEKALLDSEELIRVVESADTQLSTWKPDSELSRLNQAEIGQPVRVTPQLFQLIQKAKEWTKLTNGSFDPGIGRLLEVWKVHHSVRIPPEVEISRTLDVSGLRYISMDTETLTVSKIKDVHIDPGAFGKGEALDRAMEVAASKKMAPLMMDFGGQIAVHGGVAWHVAIAQPSNRSETEEDLFLLTTGSISTSGFSERSGKIGQRVINHILNPTTGHPVEPFGSVTVWHPSALAADILSTALYVMGPERGYQWATRNKIAAAFVIDSQKNILETLEFKKLKVKS